MNSGRLRFHLGLACAFLLGACASVAPSGAELPTPAASPAASFASSSVPTTAAPSPSPSPVPSIEAMAALSVRPVPIASVITNGPRDRRVIALTFDADMTTGMQARLRSGAVASWYDARIVAALRAAQVPATIFLTGLWTRAYPDVVRSLAGDALFELENHSMDHAGWRSPCYRLPTISTDVARRAEVTDAAEVIRSTAGADPTYFRFPGGCHTDADSALVASLGEQPLGWDAVSGDAFQADPDVIVRNVMARVRPGSIVVMHLIGAPNAPATAVALERLIPLLRAQGYEFATVSQLLVAPAASPGSGSSSPGPGSPSPG